MGRLNVNLYGPLGQALGPQIALDIALPCSIAAIRNTIAALGADLGQMVDASRCRAVVEDCFVDDEFLVETAREVEFLPTVSGG